MGMGENNFSDEFRRVGSAGVVVVSRDVHEESNQELPIRYLKCPEYFLNFIGVQSTELMAAGLNFLGHSLMSDGRLD